MKTKQHDIASELTNGQLAEVAAAIIRELPHIGLDSVTGQSWVGNGRKLRSALQKALMPQAPEQKEGIFPTKVNYDLSVESLVANGKYDWKNENITNKNFPTTKKGEVSLNMELVHFNQTLTSEEVIADLKKRGFRPAELHELLSFGIQYPEEQRKYPIVALGSVWRWDVGRRVPYLDGDGGKRDLNLDYFDSLWVGYCRFLAVRES